MRLYKESYTDKDGKRKKTQKFYVDFSDHFGRRHRLPGFAEKRATEALMTPLSNLVSFRAAGMEPAADTQNWIDRLPERIRRSLVSWDLLTVQREAGARLLINHLNDWQENIAADEKTLKHAKQSRYRAEKVIKSCGFKTIADIDAHKVKTYLKRMRDEGKVVILKQKDKDGNPVKRLRKMSKSTSNHYLRAAKMFTKWLMKEQRVGSDPLDCLEMIEVFEKDLKKKRRVLTDGECAKLLESTMLAERYQSLSGMDRALLYEFALVTGMRKTEIMTLEVQDVNIFNNTVMVRDYKAKNKQARTVPIMSDLVAEKVKAKIEHKTPRAIVFPGIPDKLVDMLKEDLKKAGVQYTIDDKDADFHAFRKTANVRMRRAGIPVPLRQAILGHKTAEMTEKTYEHVSLDEMIEAAKNVPEIPMRDQVETQATGTDGQSVNAIAENHSAIYSAIAMPEHCNSLHQSAKQTEQSTKEKNCDTITKTAILTQNQGENLTRPGGLEPPTFGFEVRDSIQLSYGRRKFQAIVI